MAAASPRAQPERFMVVYGWAASGGRSLAASLRVSKARDGGLSVNVFGEGDVGVVRDIVFGAT